MAGLEASISNSAAPAMALRIVRPFVSSEAMVASIGKR
jgi:hypothetical protein